MLVLVLTDIEVENNVNNEIRSYIRNQFERVIDEDLQDSIVNATMDYQVYQVNHVRGWVREVIEREVACQTPSR